MRIAAVVAVLGFGSLGWFGGLSAESRRAIAVQIQAPAGIAAPAASVLAGIVVAADTGRPLRRVRVSLSGGDPPVARSVVTDEAGRFRFAGLPEGEFTVSAERPGFLKATYGEARPGAGGLGRPVALTAGQRLEKIDIALPRGGALTGSILDEFGEPAAGVIVRASRSVMGAEGRVLQLAGTAIADDRGSYRIAPLPPGAFFISATLHEPPALAPVAPDDTEIAAGRAPNDPVTEYAAVYFPGTTVASGAAMVSLGVGEERVGLDIRLAEVPTGAVRGTIASLDASSPAHITVELVDADAPFAGIGGRRTTASEERFAIAGVAPGRYLLTARAALAAPGTAGSRGPVTEADIALWARAEVIVEERRASEITLSLRRGPSVSGVIAFAGVAPPLEDQVLTIALQPVWPFSAGMAAPVAHVDARGRFTFPSIAPGRYQISANGVPGDWTLQSAVFGGIDALDFLLDVSPAGTMGGVLTFGQDSAELDGQSQDAAGVPVADYTLVVFPADSRFWVPRSRRVQASQPSTNGRFAFRGLPPGEYRLAAVIAPEPDAWHDPEFLRGLVAASFAVTLSRGEKKTQIVRLASSR